MSKTTPFATSEQFGALCRAARRRQGITQRQAAMLANVGERFIVDLEAGKASAALSKALAVAAALGLKLFAEEA